MKYKGICPAPWVSIGINNNGDYRMCVQAVSKRPERGVCRNNSGQVLRIDTDSIDQARNSNIFNETRKAMLQGEFSPHCLRCQNEEAVGLESRRQSDLLRFKNQFDSEKALASTRPDGSIPISDFPLFDLDLRLNNTCNLACRMCNPSESRSWYKEWSLVHQSNTFKSYDHKVPLNVQGEALPNTFDPYQWSDKVDWIQKEFSDKNRILQIQISGGEPLVNKDHEVFLNFLIEKNWAQNIELSYNTNLTVDPHHYYPLWSKFKLVMLGCSIDGYGDLNSYIRHPSRWSQVEKNLDHIDQNSPDNIQAWITFTFQAYNANQLIPFFNWVLSKKFKKINFNAKTPIFTPHPLRNPSYLSATVLPQSLKNKITQDLKAWMESDLKLFCAQQPDQMRHYLVKNKDDFFSICKNQISALIDFMNSSDDSALFPEFTSFTKKVDAIRNQNLHSINPDLV